MTFQELHARATADNDLLTWTIYEHPDDFPNLYVVRPHSSKYACPLDLHFAHTQLAVVRGALQHLGLTCLPRAESDPPAVLETWI